MGDSERKGTSSRSFLDEELSPRAVGILALCFFPLSLYLAVIRPMAAIAAGETPEAPLPHFFVMAFLSLLFGISLTFRPKVVEKTMGNWRVKPTVLGWCIWIGVFVLAFGSYLAMRAYVKPHREKAGMKPSLVSRSEE